MRSAGASCGPSSSSHGSACPTSCASSSSCRSCCSTTPPPVHSRCRCWNGWRLLPEWRPCSRPSPRRTSACGATPQHWQRMRSSKSSKVEEGSLPWDPVGLMAGVDEAGRGPLAGPVVAAAVILDDGRRIRGLADSKQLTPLQRDRLYDQICEKALCLSIAEANVDEIDRLNI